ncbi:MAG: hydrogen peroxide-inducible genes activator [Pseudomonadales bacterium]|nr:hydrogen peroxide-inducible genes activator [Pseudomonadales bacterium]
MTLTELKYIITLSRTLHFGEAAKQCFVSQPTLSIAVKKLEAQLGVNIFERSRHALMITPVGQRIIDQAERVLSESNIIEQIALADKDPLSSVFRLGAIYTVGPYLYPNLVPTIRQSAPKMPLYVEEDFTANLRDKLSQGSLDAAVIAMPFTASDVVVKELYQESFAVLMPASHPLANKPAIKHNDLVDEAILLLGEGHCFRDQVLAACPAIQRSLDANNAPGKMIAEGSSLETIKHMVGSGLGVTILPSSAVADTGNDPKAATVVRPFCTPEPTRTIALAWRASFPRHQAIDQIIKSIRSTSAALQLQPLS